MYRGDVDGVGLEMLQKQALEQRQKVRDHMACIDVRLNELMQDYGNMFAKSIEYYAGGSDIRGDQRS